MQQLQRYDYLHRCLAGQSIDELVNSAGIKQEVLWKYKIIRQIEQNEKQVLEAKYNKYQNWIRDILTPSVQSFVKSGNWVPITNIIRKVLKSAGF